MSHSFQAYTEFPDPYTSLEEAVQELTEQPDVSGREPVGVSFLTGQDLGHAPKSQRSGS